MKNSSRAGLHWEDGVIGGSTPTWSYEPPIEAIERVCRQKLDIGEKVCTVTLYAQGAFNKLYLVEIPDHADHSKLLMRVSLPVDPRHKTRGEVTTLRWVKANTTIPVPAVICFDDSNQNDIGFEWILMEMMPGRPAYKVWRQLTMDQKTALTKEMAQFQAQLSDASRASNLRGIGTLSESSDTPSPTPGRIVDNHFFWDDHIDYDVERGPFGSTHDWLAAHLDITIRDHTASLSHPDTDEEDAEVDRAIIELAKSLLALLPKIFPVIQHPAERTVLKHHDLSLDNILLDDQGYVSAVVDWESLACEPPWAATVPPQFLDDGGPPREEMPVRDVYADDDGTVGEFWGLDNEGKNPLYWEHLMEWETARLRRVYDAYMDELQPGWEAQRADAELKLDFVRAALGCGAPGWVYYGVIRVWVQNVENGHYFDLREGLRTYGVSFRYSDDQEDTDSDDDGSIAESHVGA